MDKKLRIAFILERLGNGGAERVTAALANFYCENDLADVHVFTYISEENEYKLNSSVKRHTLNANKGRVRDLVSKVEYLTREIRKIAPDVVISLATPKTSILLFVLSVYRKYKLIISERNDPNQYPKEKMYKFLRNIAYKRSEGVVFQTEEAKHCFSNAIQAKSIVIPNPISAGLPIRTDGSEREKRIVNFCRLEPQKNIRLLIDAFADVHKKYPEFILDLYGDGEEKKSLIEYAAQLHLEDDIYFHGFEKDIHNKIINAYMFVSSSDYEGISNSMLEALAIGLPTICTDCPIGGAHMAIVNGENGILVPVKDRKALHEAMEKIIQNKELMNHLSQNAMRIRDKYSVSQIANKWLDFIKQI